MRKARLDHRARNFAGRLLALLLLLPAFGAAAAQGLTYDLRTTGVGSDPRSGAPTTTVFVAGHGQASDGNSRLDFTESAAPAGMMGAGKYLIAKVGSHTLVTVDPERREYVTWNEEVLANQAAERQALGELKMEVADLVVGFQELGSGETIEGYRTVRYRITDGYTMKVSIVGQTSQSTVHATYDVWTAPELDAAMNPFRGQAAGLASGPMAELTQQTARAFAKVGKGAVLKLVVTNESVSKGKAHTTTMTTLLTNIKRASISPTVFVVPAGYAEKSAEETALGAMGSSGKPQGK